VCGILRSQYTWSGEVIIAEESRIMYLWKVVEYYFRKIPKSDHLQGIKNTALESTRKRLQKCNIICGKDVCEYVSIIYVYKRLTTF
jgi:hypothetical protein